MAVITKNYLNSGKNVIPKENKRFKTSVKK